MTDTRIKSPLEWALHFRNEDLAVFRLKDKKPTVLKPGDNGDDWEKRPFMDGWKDEAAESLINGADDIEVLWKARPKCGVGLAMGHGFVCIDLDNKVGINGLASFAKVLDMEQADVLAMTRCHTTPSGGYHLIFTTDLNFLNSQDVLGKGTLGHMLPGVDVRSLGGYIAGPGTVVNGKTYTVRNPDTSYAALPESVLQLLKAAEERAPDAHLPPEDGWDADNSDDISMEWLATAEVSVGGRGATGMLLKTCQQLRDFTVSEAECVELLQRKDEKLGTSWNDRCMAKDSRPFPFTGSELELYCARGYMYAKRRAGCQYGLKKQMWDVRQADFAGRVDWLHWYPELADAPGVSRPLPSFTPRLPSRAGDTALGEAFHAAYKNEFIVVTEENRWLVWGGYRYHECRHGEHERAMQEFIKELRLEAAEKFAAVEQFGKTDDRYKQAESMLKQVSAVDKSHHKKLDTLASAKSIREWSVKPEDFDQDPWLLGVQNGVLDLKTGKLVEAVHEQRITKSAGCAFDPADKCPRWIQFVGEVLLEDDDLINYMQMWCGYMLTGLATQEQFLFIHGDGGRGKGKFVKTMAALLGDYACESPNTMLIDSFNEKHSTDLADLQGLRMTYTSEIGDNKTWDVERLKMLTGGDNIRARHMRQDNFSFKNQCKLVIMGNEQPRFNKVDMAIRRRLRMVPFEFNAMAPGVRDYHLEEKLLAELPGILNWALEGLVNFTMAGGLGEPPQAVTEATDDYLLEQDVIGRWLARCCDQGAGLTASASALFASFERFAAANDIKARFTAHSFAQELKRRGFEPVRTKRGVLYKGLEIRPDAMDRINPDAELDESDAHGGNPATG